METRSIPLSQLHPSPNNVRKTGGIPIYKLANSIHAHGLLQNLVVSPNGSGFLVEAGGRRLQALLELAKDGRIPKDHPVPCQVVDPGTSAHEASLAENIAREAMHPVDEFLAFKQLADEGKTAAEIADRFGATDKHIKQRLKLANVSPKLLEEYRAGKATLEQMQALALVDDHAFQEKAWAAGAREEWRRRPSELREFLTEKEIGTDTELGKFVGAAAYEKAGGIVRSDIFGLAGEAYLTDPKLVKQLAIEKLEKKAEEVRAQGWHWVEVRLEFDYSDEWDFGKSQDKKVAGAVVTIDDRGKTRVVSGLVRPKDQKAAAKSGASKGSRAAPEKKKPPKKPGDLPFAQVQRLQGIRTGIMRMELARTPRVALAALAATLAQSLTKRDAYGERGGADSIVRIQPVSERYGHGRMAPPAREALEKAPEWKVLATERKEWLDRLKPAKGDIFGWLLTQPESLTHELLAYLAASSINATTFAPGRTDEGAKFAALAGIDLSKLWTVSEAWCASQTRGYLAAAVTEACGAVAAQPIAKAPASQAAKLATPLLAAAGWVPAPMRLPGFALRALKGVAVTPAPAPAAKPAKKAAKKAAPPKKAAKKTKKQRVAPFPLM